MPLVVGVRFNPATKVYYFDPTGIEDLSAGEQVVVETSRGEEVGRVIIPPCQVSDNEVVGRLKRVRRRATAVDLMDMAYYKFRELDALVRCREKVMEHGLPMKMIRAEYNYDGRRLVFFFTAERRVDFRRLVQDLARTFKARIELRQVGVRDEAKLMGGIGKCGLSLCCNTWLTDFSPVSIKMAKLQDLPLSPMEISGVCGRLLCCLSYEQEHYTQIRKELPRRGDVVETPQGRGTVVQVNPVRETVDVELENQVKVQITREELAAPAAPREAAPPRRGGRRRRPRS